MRKIYEIFERLERIPEGVVHWTKIHGNLLLKPAHLRHLTAYVIGMDVHLRGVGTKSYPQKRHYKVLFDRSFLLAKELQVILQFHNAGINPEEIKKILLESFEVFEKELELEKENPESESDY